MQLNIKHPDAHRLATELAALTGESLTAAVTEALRERLLRARNQANQQEAERQARINEILALANELRAHVKPGTTSADHADLYGEDGLPG
jgi:antitoxin VapB